MFMQGLKLMRGNNMNLSRRTFIASAALAPVACGVPLGYQRGTPVTQPKPIPSIRPPRVGQEWTYIKRDVFDGKIRGIITERVSSVGSTIVIERSDDNGSQLPSEIQGPWGTVQLSTSWPRLLSFKPPIPLWPQELSSSWSKQFNTKYSVGGYSENAYNWQDNLEESQKYLLSATNKAADTDNPLLKIRINASYAILLRKMEKYEEAEKYFLNSLKLSEENNSIHYHETRRSYGRKYSN